MSELITRRPGYSGFAPQACAGTSEDGGCWAKAAPAQAASAAARAMRLMESSRFLSKSLLVGGWRGRGCGSGRGSGGGSGLRFRLRVVGFDRGPDGVAHLGAERVEAGRAVLPRARVDRFAIVFRGVALEMLVDELAILRIVLHRSGEAVHVLPRHCEAQQRVGVAVR